MVIGSRVHANGLQTAIVDLASVSLLELADLMMAIDLPTVNDAFAAAGVFDAIQRACLAAPDCSLLHVAAGKVIDRMLAAPAASKPIGAVVSCH